ncbi:MAG: arylsulfatase [Phycisphaerae bacterium]|nr:arylsulfatase [Phycisphaerae bacterium]
MQHKSDTGLNRRSFLHLAGISALGLTASAVCARANGSKRPNVAIILADDLGFSDIGCYGGEIETPNLDRLAAAGLRFTHFYNTGRCWPTRAAIMTGYYPHQIRMDPSKGRLPKAVRLMPHYLAPAGYRTYHSGKWHVNGAPLPVKDGGFDRSFVVHDHDRFFSPRNIVLDDQKLPPVTESPDYYLTSSIADYSIDFLKQHHADHREKPFFLYLAFTTPHFPLHAMQKDIDHYRDRYLEGWDQIRQTRFERLRSEGIIDCDLSKPEPETIPTWNLPEEALHTRIGPGEAGRAVPWTDLTDEQRRFQATKMAIHAAMVHSMDRDIGRVLDQIKAMNADDDTLVFFLSDNGASAEQIIRGDGHDPAAPAGSAASYLCLGPGWSTAANTPFRLHKTWVHEGGIATPLIVHWPNGIAARGSLRHAPGHCIDFVPTLLDLLKIDPPKTWNDLEPPALPGKSLLPAFAKDRPIERDFLFFSHINNRALRIGDYKLVRTHADADWSLYNLAKDRDEGEDLAGKHPKKVKEMANLWEKLNTEFQTDSKAP